MRWKRKQTYDIIISTREYKIVAEITKQEILQESSKIYDPLDLLNQVTVKAKNIDARLMEGKI